MGKNSIELEKKTRYLKEMGIYDLMMKTGRYWKDQAIIMKSMNFGEYDRIITLFTRKKGKMSAIAKGARKVGNRFGPALDCPALSNCMFYNGRGMPVLSQADLEECFRDIGKKTINWVFANYVLWALDRCYEPEEPDERIFETVLLYFNLAAQCDNFFVMSVKFRIDLSRLLGFSPQFRSCAHCGCHFNTIKPAGWSTALGGMVCEKCYQEQSDSRFLPADIAALLRKFLTTSGPDSCSIQLTDRQFTFLDSLVSDYLTYHVGKKITEWEVFTNRFQDAS